MGRLPKPLFSGLLCALLLGLPASGRAQPSLPEESFDPHVTDMKELARAAFEASQATPRDLARVRIETTRTELSVLDEHYRIGEFYFTRDLLPEAVARVAEAELAALEKPTPADRLAVLATHWLAALSAEQIVAAKYRVGRVPLSHLMQARRARLDAEIKLRTAAAKRELADPLPISSLPPYLRRPSFGFDAKVVARAAFEASQANLRDLAHARMEAARFELLDRYEQFRAGAPDGTLDLLLESAAHLTEAELDPVGGPTPADRLAALATRWWLALTAEQISEAKYRVGRISLADVMQARNARLDAEIKLRGAVRKPADPFALPSLPLPTLEEDPFFYSSARDAAQSAFAAAQADLRALAVARREAARLGYLERMHKYRIGAQDGTLDLLLEAARQFLDAELTVRDDSAERLAILERYWGQMVMAEDIVRRKYKLGRVGLADYMQSRRQRLDAEMRMRTAEEKVNKK